jgi:hypothetical protein
VIPGPFFIDLLPTCYPVQPSTKLSIGAGERNRTAVISLEGCCSTIELHPRTRAQYLKSQ